VLCGIGEPLIDT